MAFRARSICSDPECQCTQETIVCNLFEDYTDEFCARCGWEKMDHKPLTQIQYIRHYAEGNVAASDKESRTHIQTLLDVIDKIHDKTEEWHGIYADAKKENFVVDRAVNAWDDAGHEIDTIISDTLDTVVPGTGGAWSIVINGSTPSIHPTKFSAMFSAEAARKRGDHVDVFAEIYTEGAHSWELQPL